MSVVAGIGGVRVGAAVARPPRMRSSGGFVVPDDSQAEMLAPASGVAMPSLLALQEAETEALRDRDAKRHCGGLLSALAAVQMRLLDGADAAGLHDLAALLRSVPPAADPRLAAVQRALLQRAAIELARLRPR